MSNKAPVNQKMTFNMNISFDLKTIVSREAIDKIIADLREASGKPEFEKLPAKQRVFTKLILQSADRSHEEGVAEFLRFALRVAINDMLSSELADNNDEMSLRPSPVKIRFNVNA